MLIVILWTVVAVIAASFSVTTGFLVVCTARRIEAAGIRLNGWRRLIVKFWFYVGAVSDAVYNYTIATARFRAWPKDVMYSGRIQRLIDEGKGGKALDEARFLNAAWGDPPHIKRVPPL